MSIDDYDPFDYAARQEEYEAHLIDKAIDELTIDNIRWYLATNGDAIEKRVSISLEEAERLLVDGYFGPALTNAVTSIEIILRFFVFRPLVHGAFLADEWAQILLDKVISGRISKDRELLSKITKHWSIDLDQIKLPDGRKLWSTLVKDVWPARNDVVHKAAMVSKETARTAIDCINTLMTEVVTPLAKRIGIDKAKNGVWHLVRRDSTGGCSEHHYGMVDPFK